MAGSAEQSALDHRQRNSKVHLQRLPHDEKAWSRVEVGDEFFVGSSEGGFLSLEEFKPPIFTPQHQQEGKAADAPPQRKKAKKRLSEAPTRPAAVSGDEREAPKQKKAKRAPAQQTGVSGEVLKPHRPDAQSEAASDLPEAADVVAWTQFGLDVRLLKALATLGFSTPTPIQQDFLPYAIRDGRDIIAAAQTGSGKTLAFGLPILHLLAEEEQASQPAGLRALIFAPTRELALQVCSHLTPLGRATNTRVVPVVGGLSPAKQLRLLARKPAVIVATPGRLWELMSSGEQHLADLSSLRFLVLDEADRMVQAGHFQELSNILQQIPGLQQAQPHRPPKGRHTKALHSRHQNAPGADNADEEGGMQPPHASVQTYVVSATLTLPQSLRRRLKKGGGGASGSSTLESLMDKIAFRGAPKVVDLTSRRKLADQVEEYHLHCADAQRDEMLYYIIARQTGRALVFANAISTARRLGAVMGHLQVPCGVLHSSMQQRQRLTALDRFRSSARGVLIATDVAARGIDVQGVACVVHYQLPASADMYVHRCGRTARAGNAGLAVALVTPNEAGRFAALLQALGRDTPPLFNVDTSVLPAVRSRVKLAVRLDNAVRSGAKKRAEASWKQKAARELDIELSDDEGDTEEAGRHRKGGLTPQAAAMQQELARLLSEPLQPKFSTRFFAGRPTSTAPDKGAADVHQQAPRGQEQGPAVSAAAGLQAGDRAGTGAARDTVALARELADKRKVAAQSKAAGTGKKLAKRRRQQASAAQAAGLKKQAGARRGKLVVIRA